MGAWAPIKDDVASVVPFYTKNHAECRLTSDAVTLKLTAIEESDLYNKATVVMQNTVSAAAETLAWLGDGTVTPTLVISKAATSTVAQVVTAAGGVTGTPWGALSAIGAGAIAGVLAATKMEDLYEFKGGYLRNQRA